ncbi:MAG TPA: hypothetical protein VHV51_14235 [Polyangiaceae bacterium]|jgi:uncharacterized metal-binding protein YceD (DUF177 family)|nr:hypothetical protein [Polyangiaceae bacterium]
MPVFPEKFAHSLQQPVLGASFRALVSKAVFIVPLADLERGPRTVTFTLDEAWLRHALEGSDATPRGAGSATVELSKSGKDVMVRGHAEAALSMPCVVTLDPLEIDVRPEIFLMLSPAASEFGARAAKKARRAANPEANANAKKDGPRKRKGGEDAEEDEELGAETAARDTYEGSQIELDPFFREFLLLELPLFPRRSDLPSNEGPAIGAPPSAAAGQEPAIDPRLQPLAALRSRLREKE